jgi:hypothetical protein
VQYEINEPSSSYEERVRQKSTFDSVVRAYVDILGLSPLTARDYDEEVHPRKLVPAYIDYAVDIEHATAKALKNDAALMRQWEQNVTDLYNGSAAAHVSYGIIRDCGRIYRARKLHPAIYLKKIRKGRPDRRSANLPIEAAA